ncbi:MAG: hypothetical protein E6Z15_07275, partial [Paenibacillus macerans]|nr:hypothetical protein [Paenibacillus macerans]
VMAFIIVAVVEDCQDTTNWTRYFHGLSTEMVLSSLKNLCTIHKKMPVELWADSMRGGKTCW